MPMPPRDKNTGRFLAKKKAPARTRSKKVQVAAKKKAPASPRARALPRRRNAAAPVMKKNPAVPQAKRDTLEMDYVDKFTLADTLEALGLICWEKAEHLISNWQDTYTARPWQQMGAQLDTLSVRARNKGV